MSNHKEHPEPPRHPHQNLPKPASRTSRNQPRTRTVCCAPTSRNHLEPGREAAPNLTWAETPKLTLLGNKLFEVDVRLQKSVWQPVSQKTTLASDPVAEGLTKAKEKNNHNTSTSGSK